MASTRSDSSPTTSVACSASKSSPYVAPDGAPPLSPDAIAVLKALPGRQPILPSVVNDPDLAFPATTYNNDAFDYLGSFSLHSSAFAPPYRK